MGDVLLVFILIVATLFIAYINLSVSLVKGAFRLMRDEEEEIKKAIHTCQMNLATVDFGAEELKGTIIVLNIRLRRIQLLQTLPKYRWRVYWLSFTQHAWRVIGRVIWNWNKL